MIVYAEREESLPSVKLVSEILAAARSEQLIRFGQLEAGVADAECADCDRETGLTRALRDIALHSDYCRLLQLQLPQSVRIRPQEGFAYYSLQPEMYVAAARRFQAERQPSSCVTVGIRSIGTALSACIAQVTGGWTFTLRPRGHPFDRHVSADAALEAAVRNHLKSWFLIADEGPGLSGSSFTAVAAWLAELGVPENRIVFFPSHDPDPDAFVSERARERWPRHPRYFESFERDRYVPPHALDLSGGQWRKLTGARDIPVVPHHERRKYLDAQSGTLWKWAGLAHYGRLKLHRAEQLQNFIPRPRGLSDGFLQSEWVTGIRATSMTPELLDASARYFAVLAGLFPTGRQVDYPGLARMIEVNTGLQLPAHCPVVEDATTVAGDGRMLPYEWIQTNVGWLKTDGLDHHDDHFFPGCQDVAWDIAGAGVEFEFDCSLLAERYLRYRRDDTLMQRLAFYRVAYTAYRAGYAAMASNDPAFEALRDKYLNRARQYWSSDSGTVK